MIICHPVFLFLVLLYILNVSFIYNLLFYVFLEPSVRSELMEQVPHIAVYCQENRDIFMGTIPTYILPMVVRYLNDSNNQVFIINDFCFFL